MPSVEALLRARRAAGPLWTRRGPIDSVGFLRPLARPRRGAAARMAPIFLISSRLGNALGTPSLLEPAARRAALRRGLAGLSRHARAPAAAVRASARGRPLSRPRRRARAAQAPPHRGAQRRDLPARAVAGGASRARREAFRGPRRVACGDGDGLVRPPRRDQKARDDPRRGAPAGRSRARP